MERCARIGLALVVARMGDPPSERDRAALLHAEPVVRGRRRGHWFARRREGAVSRHQRTVGRILLTRNTTGLLEPVSETIRCRDRLIKLFL